MQYDEFSILDFVSSISGAVDLVSKELNNHHKKVAYIAFHLAREMGLPDEEIRDVFIAAILHDIGAFTGAERLKLTKVGFDDNLSDEHAIMGHKLLLNFEPLKNAARMIRYHHTHYDKIDFDIPIGSHIIHLADRVAVLVDDCYEVLEQVPHLLRSIKERHAIFHPDTVLALEKLTKLEYFWIEICTITLDRVLPKRIQSLKKIVGLDELRSFSKLVSYIIDFRSRFTSTHSAGVAAVSVELTKLYGFSPRECKMMEIAGYLHDLGKLAIDDSILEKNGTLNHREFNAMRKHSYYTYIVLEKIEGFELIADWAAQHHERLDGKGYPFHVKGDDFSKMARIMCVADIVTAITEDRPYRKGMDSEKSIKILSDMADSGGIDRGIVGVVSDNFSQINDARIAAQLGAAMDYATFYER